MLNPAKSKFNVWNISCNFYVDRSQCMMAVWCHVINPTSLMLKITRIQICGCWGFFYCIRCCSFKFVGLFNIISVIEVLDCSGYYDLALRNFVNKMTNNIKNLFMQFGFFIYWESSSVRNSTIFSQQYNKWFMLYHFPSKNISYSHKAVPQLTN